MSNLTRRNGGEQAYHHCTTRGKPLLLLEKLIKEGASKLEASHGICELGKWDRGGRIMVIEGDCCEEGRQGDKLVNQKIRRGISPFSSHKMWLKGRWHRRKKRRRGGSS